MIDRPGIYPGMSAEEYFADPCPAPSLTQSVAKILCARSPRHAMLAHPRLRGAAPEEKEEAYSKSMAIGNAAHSLMLGRGKDLYVGHYDSWRTAEARKERASAERSGQVPILARHYETAVAMVTAGQDQLAAAGLEDVFALDRGDSEVCIAWREGELWFRSLIDWLPRDRAIVWDYKTSERSVAPWVIGSKMADDGWDLQSAMHRRGLDVLAGDEITRGFRFVAQEQEPPYALVICELSQEALEMGRRKLEYAVRHWQKGILTGDWPLYPPRIVSPEYPGWAETAWLNREVHEASLERWPERDANNLMAG